MVSHPTEQNFDPQCLFCKIIHKQLPANFVGQEKDWTAIHDINPQAPTHILVMPNEHKTNITKCDQPGALSSLFQAVSRITKMHGLESFRLVINTGAQSGQSVDHLHIHILAGRQMHWPPG